MSKNRIVLAIIGIIALITLTGCGDATELGNRAIIQAVAVDYDGKYHVTAMLFSSGGSGGDTIDASQENVIRVNGEGETLAAAIDDISLVDGKRIYMSETKLLILGSGFEETSAEPALRSLYLDLRCSLNMPVCCVESGELAEDIAALQFTEGITSADKPLSLIENASDMGVSPKTTLLDLLADSEGGKASLLPMFTITENGSGMTSSDDGKTAVLSGSRHYESGVLGESLSARATAAQMLTSKRSHKTTLNFKCGGEEMTCEAYGIKITDDPLIGEGVLRVSAKFKTRGGGRLNEQERRAALNELVELIQTTSASP
ncbi:MAG: hypothetical protein K2J77_07050 [Oscillospiraceae bacterium]|nr:hypothetical protein [Oscillospiraceae bacterium]